MRRLAVLAVFALLTLACRPPGAPMPLPPSTPPVPPQTPPPLPERAINAAHVSGRVVDATGIGVDGARVAAWGVGPDCAAAGQPVVVTAGVSGEFALTVERGVGPEESGCVVIEVVAGGSEQRLTRAVVYTSAKEDPRNRIELGTVSLPPAPELTRGEGERLIGLLADAIRTGDRPVVEELDLYIRGDAGRVQAVLDAYRQYLRGVEATEFVDEEETFRVQRAWWRMTGVAGRSVTTWVYREDLIHLHGPLIDYGDRAAEFVRRVVEFAHHGDPARMARLLTADDEDVPLETAQRVIDHLRARFDLPRATVVLVGVDELGNTLRYRVSGPSREGGMSEEILEVIYGDGLVGLRGF